MPRTRTISLSTLLLLWVFAGPTVGAQSTPKADENDKTTIHVVVKDAESGSPINQARLTLTFNEPTSTMFVKHSKEISYSAKTNPQGHCRFSEIPKVTVRLLVTADNHMSFGKKFEITKDNQEIEVKLKKPQPQL